METAMVEDCTAHNNATTSPSPLSNPLVNKSRAELVADINAFANDYDLADHLSDLIKGALIAQNPAGFDLIETLTDEEREILRREQTHKWHQPWVLYRMVVMCSVAAAVNGMDLVAVNGANLFFPKQFGIDRTGRDTWILGLVNGAPYFCCSLISVWLNGPLNSRIGRRGVLFATAIICFVTCIWSACTNTWWHLTIARFFLGFGIGPKSATLSVYAAESAPANIRGALTMCWQIWVAFGIMMGTALNIAFYHVPDRSGIVGLNWRLMLGVAGLPALVLIFTVYLNPESPRWLMLKGRYHKAFDNLKTLRGSRIQAARDLYYIHVLLQEEEKMTLHRRNPAIELFSVRRNRNAVIGSFIVMFAQQFCGINIISYYSTNIFSRAGATPTHALLASWGFGMLNFLFALPAVATIDRFGRRKLLLLTFPLMAIFLFLTAGGFYIADQTAQLSVVALGIYLYVISYSPGEGPVPFVYSAEAFPLYIRDLGMSWAVFVCWFFNSIVALTFPPILNHFTAPGAFFWYGGWNVLIFLAIYFCVPETKSLTLEELDEVFDVPLRTHITYQIRQIPKHFGRLVLQRNIPREPLYPFEVDPSSTNPGDEIQDDQEKS